MQSAAHVPAADGDGARSAAGSGSETWVPPAGDCQNAEHGQTQGPTLVHTEKETQYIIEPPINNTRSNKPLNKEQTLMPQTFTF